jgi:hypothetical protein
MSPVPPVLIVIVSSQKRGIKMIGHHQRLFPRMLFLGVALILCRFTGLGVSSSVIQGRAEVNKGLAQTLSVVQVQPDPALTMDPAVGKGGLVTSPDRKYSAYILCLPLPSPDDPDRCAQRVHFEENTRPRPTTISQIRGEEELQEVTRPVDNLKWLNAFTLSYERWAQPDFGHRYLIDVRSRRQVAAYDLFE